jgi:dephospho-CoA kinase
MLKIGLTGGIGSGKTSVANIFQILGIPVFDADAQAKLIMHQDADLVKAIKNTFGEESYINGQLNRPYISNLVFADPVKLDLLNALVHPATIAAANNWLDSQSSPYVIKEAALMFESGSAESLDIIVGVHASQALRVKRVMDRDKITREQVLDRMARQIDESIKMKLCDYVIINNEQQLLIPQVLHLHKLFLQKGKNVEK